MLICVGVVVSLTSGKIISSSSSENEVPLTNSPTNADEDAGHIGIEKEPSGKKEEEKYLAGYAQVQEVDEDDEGEEDYQDETEDVDETSPNQLRPMLGQICRRICRSIRIPRCRRGCRFFGFCLPRCIRWVPIRRCRLYCRLRLVPPVSPKATTLAGMTTTVTTPAGTTSFAVGTTPTITTTSRP